MIGWTADGTPDHLGEPVLSSPEGSRVRRSEAAGEGAVYEYLTGISGRTGAGLDSITFHTNKRFSQKFGGVGGTDEHNFILPSNCEVIGFWGTARDVIVTQIGIIARSR